jgi:hypothetical protein
MNRGREWTSLRGTETLPRVGVETGRWVPGWLLRTAAVLVTGGTPLLAAPFAPASDGWTMVALIAVALAVATAWRPGYRVALIAVVVVAVLTAVAPDDDGLARAAGTAPLAYVGLRLQVWAAAIWPSARIELAALSRSARTDLIVVAATVLLGVVAALVEGASFAGLAVGAVALLLLVVLLARTGKDPS